MAFIDNILGGGPGRGNKAYDRYLSQIPGVYKEYLGAYSDAGQAALPGYQDKLNELLNDPNGFIKSIMGEYESSPYYQFQVDEMQNGSNNAAAANGTLGGGQHQFDISSLIRGLASQDQQQYLGNVVGAFNNGLTGTKGLIDLGANAGSTIANGIAGNYQDRGALAYKSALDNANRDQELFNGAIELGAMAFGAPPGAAGAAGGGGGGMQFSNAGKNFSNFFG